MRKRHGRTIRFFSFRRCLVCLFLTVLGITLLFMASFFSAWPIKEGEFSLDEMNHAQCPQKDPHKDEPRLQFSKYGTFRIALFTDLHWGGGTDADKKTRALQEEVLTLERPDFVVLGGDQIDAQSSHREAQALWDVVHPMEERGVPYATILGNHDGDANLPREQLLNFIVSCNMSRGQLGPSHVSGSGNFYLPLYLGEEKLALLYLMDSGKGLRGRMDQSHLNWFEETSKANPLPSLVFLHIPLHDLATTWETEPCQGSRYERSEGQIPSRSIPLFPSFSSNGVMGVFSGHDHKNDYCCTKKGVLLCYGRVSGYRGYGNHQLMRRGSRIIELRLDREKSKVASVETWVRVGGGGGVVMRHHAPLHSPTLYGALLGAVDLAIGWWRG